MRIETQKLKNKIVKTHKSKVYVTLFYIVMETLALNIKSSKKNV
jgi:hypothetical protein